METPSASEAFNAERPSAPKDTAASPVTLPSSETVKERLPSNNSNEIQQQQDERPFDTCNRQIMVHGVRKIKKEKVQQTVDDWVAKAKANQKIADHGSIDKIKKPPYGSWMVLTVSDEAIVQPMIDFINSGVITVGGSYDLRAHRASNNQGKRKDQPGNGNAGSRGDTKRSRKEDAVTFISEEDLKDKVTPLWKLSAEDQKDKKTKDMIRKCAMKIVQEVNTRFRKTNEDRSKGDKLTPYLWLQKKPAIHIEPIVSAPSPLRNKWELTFGFKVLSAEPGADKVPAVGFKPSGWAGGVAFSKSLDIVSPEVGKLVELMDAYLIGCPLAPYDSLTHTGFWRTVTIRLSQRTRECMLVICHGSMKSLEREENSDDAMKTAADVAAEKGKLVEILKNVNLSDDALAEPFKVTSIYFQEYEGASNPSVDHPVQHVYGKTILTESLGKCKFEISPGAFFQVNTPGAEILYGIAIQKIRDIVKNPEKTMLFDVCCGTGTIGLTCLKEGVVSRICGVDISAPAIENAKRNADLNELVGPAEQDKMSKVRFVADRAENALFREIQSTSGLDLDFIALVDPARAGLHTDVIRTLRNTEAIRRIVYVSCNPTGSLVTDAGLLCSPQTKKYKGTPFKVVSASPVDMFPLTDHCEMVMVFERVDAECSLKTADDCNADSTQTASDGVSQGEVS